MQGARYKPRTEGEAMTLSFEWLLGPITPQAFFAEYYERQPLLIARGEPRRFGPLLSLSVIDRFPCHHLAVPPGCVFGGCGRQAQRRGLYACRL
jgi:hypothetical protein